MLAAASSPGGFREFKKYPQGGADLPTEKAAVRFISTSPDCVYQPMKNSMFVDVNQAETRGGNQSATVGG